MHFGSLKLKVKEGLSFFTYPDFPILAVTTSGKDIREKENYRAYARLLDIPLPVYCQHEHRDGIVRVDAIDGPILVGDAMITNQSQIPLVIAHADCQAAILCDPKAHVLAVAHSGWRGSNLNILGKVVHQMKENFGSDPKHIQVAISPSIGPDHAQFLNYESELHPSIFKYQIKPFYFDFWSLSRDQLVEAGIQEEHVMIASFCTYANSNYCFSYRRNKAKERDATIAMLS